MSLGILKEAHTKCDLSELQCIQGGIASLGLYPKSRDEATWVSRLSDLHSEITNSKPWYDTG
jgi:hypothetical protein